MTIADVPGELTELVTAAQAGDRTALEHLLARTRPQIHRYVLSRLVDRASAEDVTQEVTIAVVSGLHRYVDTGRSPLAWMFGIAANKVNEAHRTGARRRESLVDVPPERGDDVHRPDLVAVDLETTREFAAAAGRTTSAPGRDPAVAHRRGAVRRRDRRGARHVPGRRAGGPAPRTAQAARTLPGRWSR